MDTRTDPRPPRMSGPTLKVLRHLLLWPASSGAAITRQARIQAGTLYPVLHRLERAGWIAGEWEVVDPREAGRPRRRFYTLTPVGAARARAALAEIQVEGLGPLLRRILAAPRMAWSALAR